MENRMANITAGKKKDMFSLLAKYRLVPVVSLPSVEAGLQLGQILMECGLPLMEVTFRTEYAAEAIEALTETNKDLTLLAGTVLSPEQADRAWQAGAECIVAPGFEQGLVGHCLEKNMLVCPGTVTPSEVLQCRRMGLKLVKFFPAEAAGGIAVLKAMAAVFSDMYIMPTGGINRKNLLDYLALETVVCCGGSWLAPENLMRDGNWQEIRRRIEDAVELLG